MAEKVDVEGTKALVVEKAAEATELAKAAYAKALEEGFFSHFKEYNEEIVKPLKNIEAASFDAAKTEVMATVTLQASNPLVSFRLYNVIALALGVLESLLMALLGHGMISFVWNLGVGYCIAYTLYWTMTCSQKKEYMFYSMCVLALYVFFNIYMTLSTLIYIIPAALYGAKAFIDVLQLATGFVMYKQVAGDKLML